VLFLNSSAQMSISWLVLKIRFADENELELEGIIILFLINIQTGEKNNATERGECRIWRLFMHTETETVNQHKIKI